MFCPWYFTSCNFLLFPDINHINVLSCIQFFFQLVCCHFFHKKYSLQNTYSENYRLFTNKSTASFTKSSSVWSSFSSIYFIHSIKFSLTITPMVRSMADLEADNCVITSLRSEEHTSELQSRFDLVCRLLL